MPRPEDRPIDFRIFKDVHILETHYGAGAEIIGPGKAGGLLYVVKSGVVSVQVRGVAVEEVRGGGIFGEMGMVDPRPHTASVFAITDVEAFVVNQTQFLQIVDYTQSQWTSISSPPGIFTLAGIEYYWEEFIIAILAIVGVGAGAASRHASNLRKV